MSGEPPLLVLTGATASGKSSLGHALALAHGFEILSADSMSVYRSMNIGTAKPGAAERAAIPYHGLDLVEPSEVFDTARYVREADAAIRSVRARGRRVLVVGGTPLYLMALLRGFFAGPSADPELRARLSAEEASRPGVLHERLSRIDGEAAARIHRNDEKRLVRALEVHELTGATITSLQRQFDEGPPRYPYRAVAIARPREVLHERVRTRCRAMFEAGLIEEVEAIQRLGGFSRTARDAIGYAEVLAFLAGGLPAEELEGRVRSHTHRLVRRQQTWFRRFPGLQQAAIDSLDESQSIALLEQLLINPIQAGAG